MMHRFFVAHESIAGERVTFRGGQAHQIARVLRLKPGDRLMALDDSGYEYEVELSDVSPSLVQGRIAAKAKSQQESRTEITIYQSLLKGSKFEYVLQKCTEVGVVSFVPLICRRCVSDAEKISEAKLARWRDIIREAAEQSRRGRLPSLHSPVAFEEACKSAQGLALLPWEGERVKGLRSALREAQSGDKPLRVSLLVGPEGGFEPSEVEYARSKGVLPITLGPRTLRAETAALVAASLVLYEAGDLGG